jgi:hypothetical protein
LILRGLYAGRFKMQIVLSPTLLSAKATRNKMPPKKKARVEACDCGRTKSELDTLLDKYNADVNKRRDDKNVDLTTARAFFSSTFDQTFKSGSEASPTCSKHGRPIAEHPAAPTAALNPGQPGAETTFCALVVACQYGDAVQELRRLVAGHVENDPVFCSPLQVTDTWQKTAWQTELRRGMQSLNLTSSATRDARVMGMCSGTGTGKTHALLVAPDLVGASHSVYVTYNMDQDIDHDKAAARNAIVLRVAMVHMGVSQRGCADIFGTFPGVLKLETVKLQQVVVAALREATATHLFIAVDEIRKLIDGTAINAVRRTMSAVGDLAVALVADGVTCTVLISSLTADTFTTISDRHVKSVELPPAAPAAATFIMERQLPNATPQQKAMVSAASGHHMRSLVYACQMVEETKSVELAALFSKLRERFEGNVGPSECEALRSFVTACVHGPLVTARAIAGAAPFVDTLGAIPPAVAVHVFRNDGDSPVTALFACDYFTAPAKQLELCGYHYDRFRALHALPVVPFGNIVYNVPEGFTTAWFEGLLFDKAVARNRETDPLFKQGKKQPLAMTSLKPTLTAYCFPDDDGHPAVDRACLAYNKDDATQTCLVLYQDKINAAGFAKAVSSLNAAADLASARLKVPVLCVAHVIGASSETSKEDDFRHPYVLVRDHEVTTYYSPTFAPAVVYVRQRHTLRK